MRILHLPRPGLTRLSALATALIVLSATTLATSSRAAAGQADASRADTTASRADATAAPANGLKPIAIPGLHDASYNVALLTGDQVRLTAAGNGRYSATATPTPASPAILIRANGGPAGTKAMSAVPIEAEALIASGALDRNLFDITWLAAHGDIGPRARIPVTVQYGGQLSAATLQSKAALLTGATLVATHPDTSSVELNVDAAAATKFWAELTANSAIGLAGATSIAAPHLAGGASRAWPTGHQTAATPAPAANQPLYRLTVTIKFGGKIGCAGSGVTLCLDLFNLYGVAGDAADNGYVMGFGCVDADPCTTWRGTISLPAGVYNADGFAHFFTQRGPYPQWLYLNNPQITVAGDTSVTFDVDAAQKFSFSTPRPSQAFSGALNAYRSLADGRWAFSGQVALDPNYWATPTEPVTIGTYHVATDWVLGKPQLTMSVTKPKRLDLDAKYWTYRDAQTAGFLGTVHFDGQQRLQLVDAGEGRDKDFAGLDARGKLVLMRLAAPESVCLGGLYYGIVFDWQLANAIKAGAAAVLIDPSSPAENPDDGFCGSVLSEAFFNNTAPLDIPFAEIPVDQASTLRGLLAHDTVKIDVSGYKGNSPYIYTPNVYKEGRIPTSLHTTITDSELTTVIEHYHADQPTVKDKVFSAWASNDYFGFGVSYESLAAPSDMIEYRGPVSPDIVYDRYLDPQFAWDAITQPGGTSSEDWNDEPVAPGAWQLPNGIVQAQPGKYDFPNTIAFCAFCRQGDTFYPITSLESASPNVTDGPYGFDPATMHLYHDGQEIEPTLFAGSLASYRLPAEKAGYQLDTHYGDTSVSWDFNSEAPSSDHVGEGYACIGTFLGSSDAPCAPDPLVFLRYNANASLSNTVAAPGGHLLQVTGYHQAPDAPAIRSMKVWTSVDGGATWQAAKVTGGKDGTYTAAYTVPDLSKTNGAVSIKAQASDADGNDINETILNAVKLAPRTSGAQ